MKRQSDWFAIGRRPQLPPSGVANLCGASPHPRLIYAAVAPLFDLDHVVSMMVTRVMRISRPHYGITDAFTGGGSTTDIGCEHRHVLSGPVTPSITTLFWCGQSTSGFRSAQRCKECTRSVIIKTWASAASWAWMAQSSALATREFFFSD